MGRPLSHKRTTNLDRFYYGSPYYPEHWDEETRADDPERMAAAGWNMVRMAEFAWDLMEPREGEFNFSLFDQTIERMLAKGITTMLCTPTATPPRWLTHRHPEMLREDADGARLQHGARQHACYASPVLREYSRKITRAMAEHFKDTPGVVGWQTDNEINCQFPECHCPNCQAAFREFLGEKYQGDIQALNKAWGTAFWSQSYTDFEEIETPKFAKPTHPNPSQVLDYYRYISWSVVNYQRDQVEILREVQPNWFVTHNGMFRHIDYRGPFTQDLDFIGYDLYPFFNFNPQTRPFTMAYNLDRARAWSGNYMVPEQQSGPGGQGPYFHDNPEPGEMRRMAYTSIARGADSLLFFRWRTARFGAEEYWCGILDHDNIPRRRYREAQQLGEELKRVGPAVLGTHVLVKVGVAAADQDANDAHLPMTMGLPSPDEMANGIHTFFFKRGYAAGCVHPSDDLSDLQLYFIPHWSLFDSAWVDNLTDWVNRGGVLVIGARTASKDLNNHVISQPLPGVLSGLAGVTVTEYGKQNAPESRPLWAYLPADQYQTLHWYEVLEPDPGADVEVLATWKGRHLDGQPAITARRVGKGLVIYAGVYLTENLLEGLLPEIERHAEITKIWPFAPEGVEVVCRQNEEKEVWFFINYSEQPARLERLPQGGTNLITGQPVEDGLELPPNEVAIIQVAHDATPGV
jgi:beta-galactosidase